MADDTYPLHLDKAHTHARREPVMDTATSAAHADAGSADGIFRAELPADLTSARQARSAVRTALAAWGMDDPDGDTELLASELVANAAEHAGASPISLALRRHREPGGQPGSPARSPTPHRPCPGLARPSQPTSAAAAWRSSPPSRPTAASEPSRPARPPGSPSPSRDRIERSTRQAEPEAEAGA